MTIRLPREQLAPYLLQLPEPAANLSWSAVFGNASPVEIEVGFGKGRFLLTASRARPEVNFVGIEIALKHQLFAANRLAKRDVANARLIRGDALEVLRDYVGSSSCLALHIYFPDPWWKKRHYKRRLVTPAFVAQCARVLQAGGQIHFATDVADYFTRASRAFAAEPSLMLISSSSDVEAADEEENQTNFERKAFKQGRPVHRAIYQKAQL